jgi:hypothetical protein
MNVEIGTEAAQFPEKEYINGIAVAVYNSTTAKKGNPAFNPRSVKMSLTQNCLRLTIPGFPYNLLPVSCGDIGFKKILDLVLAWKSGLKVPLLPLGRFCSLQTILPSDLVGCDSPL